MTYTVVSDTSPLNYLVLIKAVELLPRLFSEILIPPAVVSELTSSRTPEPVLRWYASQPSWLITRIPKHYQRDDRLDAGEEEAIALMEEIGNCVLLVDERKARETAKLKQLPNFGTLGVLVLAANRELIDFEKYTSRLRNTSFRIDDKLISEARQLLKVKTI